MSKLLSIRPVIETDLPMLLEWRNHPDIRCSMFTQHVIDLAEHKKWFVKTRKDSKYHLLLVEEGGEPFGFVQFNPVSVGGIADWGFYVRPNAAKGSGMKLGQAALSYAFERQKLHKVCGLTIEENQASINFHKKLGFIQEGVLREQKQLNNSYHSVFCFGLLASEWQIRKTLMRRDIHD